jgi:hypothetical protein
MVKVGFIKVVIMSINIAKLRIGIYAQVKYSPGIRLIAGIANSIKTTTKVSKK